MNRIIPMLLPAIILLCFTGFVLAENSFYLTAANLTVKQDAAFCLRFPAKSTLDSIDLTNIQFNAAGQRVTTSLEIKRVQFVDNVLEVELICSQPGVLHITGFTSAGQSYETGNVTLNVVTELPLSHGNLFLIVISHELSANRARADYGLELSETAYELTYIISPTSNLELAMFMGLPEVSAEMVYLTTVEIAVDGVQRKFTYPNYQLDVDLKLFPESM